jgi:hypothetical protein
MIVIKSQKYTDAIGEELISFLGDIEHYTDAELVNFKKFAFWHMQLARFNRKELKSIIGHVDALQKERRKNKMN